jgi:hypothetical protein
MSVMGRRLYGLHAIARHARQQDAHRCTGVWSRLAAEDISWRLALDSAECAPAHQETPVPDSHRALPTDLYTRRVKTVPSARCDEEVLAALSAAQACGADLHEVHLLGVCNEAGRLYRSAVLHSSQQLALATKALQSLGLQARQPAEVAEARGFDIVFVNPLTPQER